MKSIILFACFLGIALATTPATTITNGQVLNLNFPVSTDSESVYRELQNFKIWIPTNASVFNLTGYDTDGTCFDPILLVSAGRGQPCRVAPSDYPFGTDNLVPCDNYFSLDTFSSNVNLYGTADYDGSIDDMQVGSWWYISVGKDTSNYLDACTFTVIISYTACATNEVSTGFASSAQCIPTAAVPSYGTWFTAANVTDTTPLVYVATFATEQNWVTVEVNTTNDFEISGQWGFAQQYSDNFRCYTTISLGDAVMTCYSVPAGPFYITLQSFNTEGGSTVMKVTGNTCAAGTSGIKCGATAIAFNTSSTYTRSLAPTNGVEDIIDEYYIDLPANTSSFINVTVSALGGTSSGVLVYKKDAFAYDSSGTSSGSTSDGFLYSNDRQDILPAGLYLRPEDTWSGGRYYFAIVNIDFSTYFNYTLSAKSGTSSSSATITGLTAATGTSATATGTSATGTGATGTSATGTAATGTSKSTTGTGSTTGKATTGAASSVIVPAFLMVAMMLALLF
jgi:hypothetical protein